MRDKAATASREAARDNNQGRKPLDEGRTDVASPGGAKEKTKTLSNAREYSMSRDSLLERIGDVNDFERPRPLVSLEEFFDGNDDYASIGYNLPDRPSPSEFYRLFMLIRNRPDVADVLVEVKELEDPDGWPFSDTVWVITNPAPDDVHQWFSERFAPDEVIEGFPKPGSQRGSVGYEVETYHIPDGMEAIGLWWD